MRSCIRHSVIRHFPASGGLMETSLHRQLKALYADDPALTEVRLGDFRIDALRGDELIEVQHGSLSAIRRKVAKLVRAHRVRVVKPIVVRKHLVKQDAPGGAVLSRRRSPKVGTALDVFDELIYFTGLFPHERLAVDVVLVDVEEWRYPGHGRRRRRRERDHQVEDQKLLEVRRTISLRTAADLRRLLPGRLPKPFHTGHLAARLDVPRPTAQRVAYCLRHAGTVRQVGKAGNALLYEFMPKPRRRRKAA
jgi:hypothetical protein